jgi:hypothetical protein
LPQPDHPRVLQKKVIAARYIHNDRFIGALKI